MTDKVWVCYHENGQTLKNESAFADDLKVFKTIRQVLGWITSQIEDGEDNGFVLDEDICIGNDVVVASMMGTDENIEDSYDIIAREVSVYE